MKDILVGADPSTAGEGRLKLALNLMRAHQAHVTACYIMREEHAAPSPIQPGVPVNPGPGVLIPPEAGTPAAAMNTLPTFGEFTDFIGLPQVREIEQRYAARNSAPGPALGGTDGSNV